MVETEKTRSESTKESGDSDLRSSCCNFENMAQMMRKFCNEKDKTFDCCTMMQKMCGSSPKGDNK